MRICDKTYNVLKWMAQLLLPAMGTLYFALASIWRLPYGEQVVGTITAVDTFLGVILGITTAQYKQKQKTDAARVSNIMKKPACPARQAGQFLRKKSTPKVRTPKVSKGRSESPLVAPAGAIPPAP